jgi:hypothetical protein
MAQLLHLPVASDEPNQSASRGHVQARTEGSHPSKLVDAQRLLHPPDLEVAEVGELEVPLDELRRLLGQVDGVGGRQVLHARCESDGVALRRVVHAQVVPDLPDDDLSGVDPHPHREAEPPLPLQLLRVPTELPAHVERCKAGALRVILVRDRRTEERHDSVARVLVDRPLVAVHAGRQDLKEAVQDPVPLLGIDLLGQIHRPLHVGEQNRDLLPLALESALRPEDLVREVLGCVGAGVGLPREGPRRRPYRLPTPVAELLPGRILHPAGRARDRPGQGTSALATELGCRRVCVAAGWAVHAYSFRRSMLRQVPMSAIIRSVDDLLFDEAGVAFLG